jgi:hypothetical protein
VRERGGQENQLRNRLLLWFQFKLFGPLRHRCANVAGDLVLLQLELLAWHLIAEDRYVSRDTPKTNGLRLIGRRAPNCNVFFYMF